MPKCPNGLIIGTDYNNFDLCEDCHGDAYHYCKEMRSSCVGKADFGSFMIANMEIDKFHRKGQDLDSYKCQYCNGIHIGRSWKV